METIKTQQLHITELLRLRILVFLEGILERDGAVEYEMAGGAVLVVRRKVAETEELEAVGSGAVLE